MGRSIFTAPVETRIPNFRNDRSARADPRHVRRVYDSALYCRVQGESPTACPVRPLGLVARPVVTSTRKDCSWNYRTTVRSLTHCNTFQLKSYIKLKLPVHIEFVSSIVKAGDVARYISVVVFGLGRPFVLHIALLMQSRGCLGSPQ